ncbi:MAG TPA: hypothetical protein VKB34_08255 [Povalibacter sp.]|nr:hypothetical protein [Povalibacter sp.]
MSTAESNTPPKPSFIRRYTRELTTALIFYVIALVIRHYALARGWWPLGFTLLPAIPVAFAIAAILRVLSRMDELQRQIQLYAFAFSAMVTAFVSVVCGLLEDVSIGRVSIWIVWPLICGLWGISSAVLSWHYGRSDRD